MRSLDRCPKCQVGILRLYSAKTRGLIRVRYLRCDSCRHPEKEIVHVDVLGRQIFFPVGTSDGTPGASLRSIDTNNGS
jgi:hypothetical protein